MRLYVAQDWAGNVYVSDDKDLLPPDTTDFHEVFLPDKGRVPTTDATLQIDVQDYSEIISLDR